MTSESPETPLVHTEDRATSAEVSHRVARRVAVPKALRGAMARSPRLHRYEKRTEWPLAIAAVIFLTAYSVQVLASGAILLVYAASLALLDAERYTEKSNIRNFGDAVWSAIETVTTVGYGDAAPVTGLGRMIAVALMIGGISIVGVVTATLASWIVQRVSEEDTAQQAATAAQIDALRDDLERRVSTLQDEIKKLTNAVTRDGVG